MTDDHDLPSNVTAMFSNVSFFDPALVAGGWGDKIQAILKAPVDEVVFLDAGESCRGIMSGSHKFDAI